MDVGHDGWPLRAPCRVSIVPSVLMSFVAQWAASFDAHLHILKFTAGLEGFNSRVTDGFRSINDWLYTFKYDLN